MDFKEIQSFIDETIYDLQTIKYFLEYDRVKETVPIARQVLTRIQSFRSLANGRPDGLKDIFQESFWDKDLGEKLESLQNQDVISQKDLDSIGYLQLIERLRSWSYENIFLLKKTIKSPQQKKIESTLMFFSAFAAGLCLASIFSLKSFLQDWGLKGDFYKGQNFEKYLSTGPNKIIDFGYYLEMNPRMPYEHSSARWQGFLIIPKDGTYTLSVIVDDGARVFIDGDLIINAWHDNDSVEYWRKIYLSRGEHSIRLEYYNDLDKSVFKLYWAYEGGKKEIIPAWYLRHS